MNKTAEKDKINAARLSELGWKVLVIWECELKKDKRELTLQHLLNELV